MYTVIGASPHQEVGCWYVKLLLGSHCHAIVIASAACCIILLLLLCLIYPSICLASHPQILMIDWYQHVLAFTFWISLHLQLIALSLWSSLLQMLVDQCFIIVKSCDSLTQVSGCLQHLTPNIDVLPSTCHCFCILDLVASATYFHQCLITVKSCDSLKYLVAFSKSWKIFLFVSPGFIAISLLILCLTDFSFCHLELSVSCWIPRPCFIVVSFSIMPHCHQLLHLTASWHSTVSVSYCSLWCCVAGLFQASPAAQVMLVSASCCN